MGDAGGPTPSGVIHAADSRLKDSQFITQVGAFFGG